jgi:peptidyl-prolyl cis-trans isomerase B (cyclophilin B)
MKSWICLGALSLTIALLAGCSGQKPAADFDAPPPQPTNSPAASAPVDTNEEVAVIDTSDGQMVLKFWPDVAPNTVANFKKLAGQGFYNGTCFHRIIKGFMIQGGDPLTKDPSKEAMWGTGGPGYTIPAEFSDRPHETGVISMARGSDPNSAGSQFFICDAPADNPNMQYLDGKYTDFGKLIKGYDVLKKIADTPVGPNAQGEMSKPLQRVNVISIKIVPADKVNDMAK